jgi:hypothetical protein
MPGPVWAPHRVVLGLANPDSLSAGLKGFGPICVIQTITSSDENSDFAPNALSHLDTPGPELPIKHASEERVVHGLFVLLGETKEEKARLASGGGPFLRCADFIDDRGNRHPHHHVARRHRREKRHRLRRGKHRRHRHSCG